MDVIEYKTRPLLKKIGDENPELFDIIHIQPIRGLINNNIQNYLSLPDLIKYRYLIDIGGNGYSGRLKFLLFSKRPLLIVERNYIEYFQDELVPFEHYIPVKMDLSDLIEKVYWIKNNPIKSFEIANNAFNYACNNFTDDKLIDKVHEVYNNLIDNNLIDNNLIDNSNTSNTSNTANTANTLSKKLIYKIINSKH
jgi:hypothetical protein